MFGNGLLIYSLVRFFMILMPMVYFGVLWGILMLWEWVWWVYRFNEFCRDTHGFSGCICVILWVVFCLLGLFFVAPVLCHSLVQWAEWSFVIHLYLVAGGNNNIKMRIVNQFLNNNMHFLNVCYCLIWLRVLVSCCFALKLLPSFENLLPDKQDYKRIT